MRRRAMLAGAVCALGLAGCDRRPAETGQSRGEGRLAPLLKNLGNLHFPITTKSPEAQRFFNQGLTLVYAFNHAEALRSFREAARIDGECGMAYWGQALALAPNINDSAIGPDREKQGFTAITEALKRKATASAKEQALIEALAARFTGAEKADRKALNGAYAAAMAKVYAGYDREPDIAALYADAVMNTMPWDYWAKPNRPKAGVPEARAALERAMREFPDHPGAHHFYIHLMEASDEVDLAVPSADKLGTLAPAAGHLVHMPAHVYMRVGRYADASAANIKAISADEDYLTQCRAQGMYPAAYYPHNIHFLNASLAMEGRSQDALEAARKVAAQHSHEAMHEPGFGFAHLLKSLPLLTMVRFGHWAAILREREPPKDQAFGRAMRHFARGFALAAQERPEEADKELAGLRKLAAEPGLKELKIFDLNELGKLAEIAAAMLEGEVARKRGRVDAAVSAYRRAVEMEDGLLYSEPPDWMLPPRQYLGDALAWAKEWSEAERVYREDLRRHRDNGWSLAGLERCLREQGKGEEAEKVRRRFQKAWGRADVEISASRM